MTAPARKKLLFLAENASLGQVSRLATLASCLPDMRYQVTFACAEFDERVFGRARFERRAIFSVPREHVLEAVGGGRRAYDRETLERYVSEEITLFRELEPDLVVGAGRPSLAISGPTSGVRVATVVNAHLSPFAERGRADAPQNQTLKLVGAEATDRLLPHALPLASMQLAKPVNDLRRRYGLSLLVSLEEVLTWGDFALYPDIPELAPTSGTPPTHRYLGAVPSSVTADLPPWWDDLPANRPLVYATLGSSGGAAAWPVLLEALARLPVTVLVAAALRVPVRPQRGNLYMADFLPGTRAAERAAVVVSNGGPATSYQALAAGKPVLGIASTYDQCLTAAAIADAGAGLCLRTAGVTAEQIERAVTELLEVQRYRSEAARLAVRLASYDTVERFRDFVREATDPPEVA